MTEQKHSFKNLPSLTPKNDETSEGSSPLTMDKNILNEYFSPFSRVSDINGNGVMEKAWKRFTK